MRLRVSLEKMEVLWVGQQKKDLDIRLDGKKLNQRDSFSIFGWSGLWGRQHRDGNSQESTSWGECVDTYLESYKERF